MVWYPLGRPVGTTIYPGMQFTAVFLKNYILPDWSLNDVCVFIPAWFGVIATIFTGLLTYECCLPQNTNLTVLNILEDILKGKITDRPYQESARKSMFLPHIYTPALECTIMSMAMMAIVPAHLMRSVGGGYDNESVAMTAMVATFYFWVRSLRHGDKYSWVWGIGTGLAYFYMVAAWGGYIFVLNMIGLHAALLVAMGRFQTKVYAAYSLFYLIGTTLAIQIPVVGWSPLKSLEQLGPCAVFLGYQFLLVCEIIRKKQELSRRDAWKMRLQLGGGIVLVAAMAIYLLAPSGYFGPLSARVRGLFVQHTKTGNPLVDSVAEHQKASNQAYFQYLHHVCSLAPIGFFVTMWQLSDASSFLLAWGLAGYYFSNRMVRLILLTAPIGSILGGIAAGQLLAWCFRQLWDDEQEKKDGHIAANAVPIAAEAVNGKTNDSNGNKNAKESKRKRKKGQHHHQQHHNNNNHRKSHSSSTSSSFDGIRQLQEMVDKASKSPEGVIFLRTFAVMALLMGVLLAWSFKSYSWRIANDLSHPSIIVKAKTRDGRVIKVDDYREAYWWIRDNTPEDARILSWWDYGYQLTAIANRTTIADGNTWNHEHIALLGKALTTDINEGHEIAKHLSDYVLIWGGGGGDDLAKSPHLARIANSVYRDHCPQDPTCRAFGFMDRGTPSPMMERSLLFQLHSHMIRPNVVADPELFEEVFRSKYGRVRVYKVLGVSEESKQWVMDPANRMCDVEGSWFCPGQYPPGLNKILSRKKDFAQLEDFNRGDKDEEYQKEYFEALRNPEKAREQAIRNQAYQRNTQRLEQRKVKAFTVNSDGSTTSHGEKNTIKVDKKKVAEAKAKRDAAYNNWRDSEDTTLLYTMIQDHELENVQAWLEDDPYIGWIRSKDGRGPMWWAFESQNQEMVEMLMRFGIPHTDADANGLTPVDMLKGR